MPLAVALEDVKSNQIALGRDLVGRKGGARVIRFIGSRDNPDLPLASLGLHDSGYFNGPHFHTVDQFQIVVEGTGTLGRHALRPYSVHFSRAYTPYGPLISDAGSGLDFFVLRAHPDTDSQRLPQEREQLRRAIHRKPWQITRQVAFPALEPSAANTDVVLREVPGMKDDRGLAAYTLSMKANSKAQTPDPSHGDGLFLVVLKGSFWHADKERKALALVYVSPREAAYSLHAGPAGVEALVLNFPLPHTGVARTATLTKTGLMIWQCSLCSFVYDEAAGLPEEGIAPGTRWADVPESWSCPDCSASKSDFQMTAL